MSARDKTIRRVLRENKPTKFRKVMREFGQGTLHSGKGGPVVTNPRQAVAIAYSEARRGKKR